VLCVLAACGGEQSVRPDQAALSPEAARKLLIVDCLLPGQVRKLGSSANYLTARRPAKISASECEIRGGEYTAYDRADMRTSLNVWLPEAQTGDPQAQTYVGEIFERGFPGAPADYQAAAIWYKRAAEQGYSRAQTNLGYLYEKGLGVAKDPIQALNWYRKASGLTEELVTADTLRKAEVKLAAAEKQVAASKAETASLRSRLSKVEATLAQQNRAEQQLQRELQDARSIALNASGSTTARLAPVEPAATEASRRQLEQLQAQLAEQIRERSRLQQEAELLKARLAAEQQGAAALRSQLEETGRQLAGERAERDKVLAERSSLLAQQRDEELATKAEVEALRQQLQDARSALADQQRQGKARQSNISALDAELNASVQRLQLLEQELTRSRTKIAEGEAQLSRLQSESELEINRLKADLDQERRSAAARGSQDEQARQRMEALQKQLAEAENKFAGARADLARSAAEAEQAQREITRLRVSEAEKQLAKTEAALAQAAPEVAAEVEPVKRLQIRLKPIRQQLADQQQSVERQIQQGDRQARQIAESQGRIDALQGEQLALRGASQSPEIGGGSATPREALAGFGHYFALIIGNDNYQFYPRLSTAVSDARAIEEVLRDRYHFSTQLLLDANYAQILDALSGMQRKLGPADNLLIYYAGHGELEQVNDRSYWIPVEAKPGERAFRISNQEITDIINVIPAKHVMVIADSCYSGQMATSVVASVQGGKAAPQRPEFYEKLSRIRSRTVLSSGGLAPVLDVGGGQHSVFAKQLLAILQSNSRILEGPELYLQVSRRVRSAAQALGVEQDPQYGPIRHAGDRLAPFLFLPQA